MRSLPIALSCCVATFFLAAAPAARAVSEYLLSKISFFSQSGDTLVTPNSGGQFLFVEDAAYQGSVTGPGNTPVIQIVNLTTDGDYEAVQTFSSQAAMDAVYPSGTYVFSVQTQGLVNDTITGDLYPPTPRVVNGYWSGNFLYIDPLHDSFIGFSSFPNFNSTGLVGQVSIDLVPNGAPELVTQYWTSSPSTGTSPAGYTIPAGTLTPGENLILTLRFAVYTNLDQTSVPGSIIGAVYECRTSIAIKATAPPSAPLTILVQPQSQTVSAGSTVVFNFGVGGTPSPNYQWYHNQAPLAGSPATLTLSGVTAADSGTYYCVATNSSGTATSQAVTLTVSQTQDIGRLVNISCRSQVGTGGNIMIVGFVVGGGGTSGTESLLTRGSGPALVPFGVTGTLADPELQIFSGSSLLASNSGWAGSAAVSSAATAVHAFAWTSTSSHDSAVVQPLASGAYTAQIAGQSGDTGVALAEVYDNTPSGTYTASTPRLINISARVQVGTGGNILIAGFVIGGSTSRTLLIRASGPALVPFGVTGTLPDPKLQLYSGTTVLASNNGWAGDPAIQAAIQKVQAFGWSNPASADSAILMTLPPGAYTAQVSGASGDTGVALVEIYEVP